MPENKVQEIENLIKISITIKLLTIILMVFLLISRGLKKKIKKNYY